MRICAKIYKSMRKCAQSRESALKAEKVLKIEKVYQKVDKVCSMMKKYVKIC